MPMHVRALPKMDMSIFDRLDIVLVVLLTPLGVLGINLAQKAWKDNRFCLLLVVVCAKRSVSSAS